MFFQKVLLGVVALTSLANASPSLFPRQSTTCSTPNGAGFCQNTGNTCTGGTYYAGYCPGASDVQCCVAPCSTSSGSGSCLYTSTSCSGTFVSGACPGPSNYQCCVTSSGGGGGGGGAGTPGLDISAAQSSSFWSCPASNYGVVAIRGYQQACGSGGQVDPNFVASYQAAQAAGVGRVDAYLYPCTGTSNGVACKSPSTQLNEFMSTISNNGMTLGHLWFDIEPTSTSSGAACNSWQLGASANEALAKQWVSLLEGTGATWGIYANGNQWSSMFASRSTDIGSQLPLWGVQVDQEPGVNTLTTFMGGWTSGSAKQYSFNGACGGSADLDSFL